MSQEDSTIDHAGHWRRTRNLMLTTLGIWFVFSYLVHWFGSVLNGMSFLGFPFGFYMAAQGSLVIFVILLFWFAHAQNKIDREFNVDEVREKQPVEEEN